MILKELFLVVAVHLSLSLCEPQTQQLDTLKIKGNDDTKEDLKASASVGLYQYAGYGKYPYSNGLYGGAGYGGGALGGTHGYNNYGYSSPSYDYGGYGGYGSGNYGKGYGSSNTYFYPQVGTGYSNYPLNGYGGYGGYGGNGGNGGLLSYSGYQHQGYYNNGLRGYDSTLSGNLGYGYYSQNYPNHDYNGYSKYPTYRGGYSLPGYVSGYRGYTR